MVLAGMRGLYRKFIRRTTILESRLYEVQMELGSSYQWKTRNITEGIISDLWQSWSNFCREIIIVSCSGCVSRTGCTISARNGDNTWQRLGYEAVQGSRGNNIKQGKKLIYHRQEPTWGDQDKILDIVKNLNPTNSTILLSAFGLPFTGPRHLQSVRNACAHKNPETMGNVSKLLVDYHATNFKSPSDLVWEISATAGQCAVYQWIEEMETIALEATK